MSSAPLQPYVAVLEARFRMLLQYRAAALAGFVTQGVFGALKLMVLAAFYGAAKGQQPISLPEVVSYVWLCQAMFALIPWNVDDDLAQQVRSGGVAYDLLRPLDLYAYWFARTLAFRTARTALRALPLLALVMIVLPLVGLGKWSLPPPPSAASAAAFGASLVAVALLSTAITMLLQVNLLYALTGVGANSVLMTLVSFFSGLLVPLPLLPSWAQRAVALQPLRGLADVPFRIYSGHISPTAAVGEIGQQLLWTCALVLLGRILLGTAARRVVIQGG